MKEGEGGSDGAAGRCRVAEDACTVGRTCVGPLLVLRGMRVRYALLELHMAIMADVDELC